MITFFYGIILLCAFGGLLYAFYRMREDIYRRLPPLAQKIPVPSHPPVPSFPSLYYDDWLRELNVTGKGIWHDPYDGMGKKEWQEHRAALRVEPLDEHTEEWKLEELEELQQIAAWDALRPQEYIYRGSKKITAPLLKTPKRKSAVKSPSKKAKKSST